MDNNEVNGVQGEPKTPPPSKIRRRTIVQGAAWSIPVIATAVAAPSAAASGLLTVAVRVPVTDCQQPGTVLANGLEVQVSDQSGPVSGATVSVSFTSGDGGTLEYGGRTYPGANTPVTAITDGAGRATLANVKMGTPTTVSAQATVTLPDGRTAVSNIATYQICAPCAQEATPFFPASGENRDAVVDAAGNLYVSHYLNPKSVTKISPTGQELWSTTGWAGGSLGVAVAPDGRVYASHGWPTTGPAVYELNPSTGAIVRELVDSTWIAANANRGHVYPYGITFPPDGATMFVTDYRDVEGPNGQIIAVNLATGQPTTFAAKKNFYALADIVSDGKGGFYGTHRTTSKWQAELVHIDPSGTETSIATFPGDGLVNYFTIENGAAYVGTAGTNHYKVDLATGAKTRLDCLKATYVTQIVRIPGTNDAYVVQWTGPILKVKNLFTS